MPVLGHDQIVIEEDDNDSLTGSEGGSEGSFVNGENEESNVVSFHSEPRKKILKKKKKLTKRELRAKKIDKINLLSAGLVKPDVTTDKEKERLLRRIATKGVVQLFNAVAGRQKTVNTELSKKMTMKERRAALKKLKGDNFSVNGTKEKKELLSDESDNEAMDSTLDCKDENEMDE
ncbi:unnamed protein product [Auanema sp. JU1783]|nr:unnamed protein product [Auanema sp. JU1783]